MDIFTPTREEAYEAERYCARWAGKDKALYDRARGLQNKIGMGGLWRGSDMVLAEIIRALNDAKMGLLS